MGGVLKIGGAILSRASQRMEVTAQNMVNMTTPGYKARRPFSALVQVSGLNTAIPSHDVSVNFTSGKVTETGNPYDLAIMGDGFFVVRSGDLTLYTRNGQFSRDAEGRLVTGDGMALQSASGDVLLGSDVVTIAPDGTVLDGGEPVARIAIADFEDRTVLRSAGGSSFEAPAGAARERDGAQVRQGLLETANVSTAEEMIAMMGSLRSAESGQRIIQVYDDLMGRALTAFGQV